jgi:VanZ family protein
MHNATASDIWMQRIFVMTTSPGRCAALARNLSQVVQSLHAAHQREARPETELN